ncbi:uncharacterized protein LOC6532770 [Drosophila yakuba]|uniref:Chitin-binding type-2 domain-containing protein n=1 Tax=Drosophila yakuba TaxID=7245 RepID=B4PGK6_DROYA|nr:uncharacterized protein LOC6532770 [Drosophila yakuba]EDW93224.2 uncharacterized protein Dyak_GE21336 [Drosophila yakuba]
MRLCIMFLLLLATGLSALPASEFDDQNSTTWTAEEACSEVTKSTIIENQEDPTCRTYVYCYVTKGSVTSLIRNCKTNQYFDPISKMCSSQVPAKCSAEATEPPIQYPTEPSTESSEICEGITKSSIMKNEDDPTCKSYIYCYVSNGSVFSLTKTCKTGEYFDATLYLCSSTKPDYCV